MRPPVSPSADNVQYVRGRGEVLHAFQAALGGGAHGGRGRHGADWGWGPKPLIPKPYFLLHPGRVHTTSRL